jgi:hypothetical protein
MSVKKYNDVIKYLETGVPNTNGAELHIHSPQ